MVIEPKEGISTDSLWMHEGLMFVKARINGEEGTFLIDNGFSISALDRRFVSKHGWKLGRSTVANDANNKNMKFAKGKIKEAEVAGFRFLKEEFLEVDTQVFFPCYNVDGVIGANIINRVNWKFDIVHHKVTISKKPIVMDGLVIKAKYYANNRAALPLSIRQKEFVCKVDLGMTRAFKVQSSEFLGLFEQEEYTAKVGATSISVGGLGKSDTSYFLKKPVPIYSGDVLLPISTELKLSKEKYMATVGMGYFKYYNLVINSTTKEYILQPNAKQQKRGNSYAVSSYLIDDYFKVISYTLDATYTSGLALGDTVLSINGVPAEELQDICDYRELLKKSILSKEPLILQIKGKGFEALPLLKPD